MKKSLLNRKGRVALSLAVLIVTMLSSSCGTTGTRSGQSIIEHRDGGMDLHSLALRFAPRLKLHALEPYGIIEIIPVFHPAKPIIAYHIFFEDDALFAGRGKETDHEVLWVEYDPVTYKVSDVLTLWHRTVLRTDTCLLNAKASQQRPSVCVQWGQHGLLPLGWEKLPAVRPRAELSLYYQLVTKFSRVPGMQEVDPPVVFRGSAEEYRQFTEEVDAVDYIGDQDVIVAERSLDILRSRLKKTIGKKKDWPFWAPH